MTIFQQWLIEQRQIKQFTIEQLAHKLGKSIAYVENIESGKHPLDVVEYLYYCKALDISPTQGLEIIELNLTSH